ncbi:cell division protein [Bifidobacterium sp. 64T4]|uniref:cell division protein n=1 Tax=Bifidobacterium pongonis TaxID=2834432 RepID=UPI001C59D2D1|nr:cell division protein [Bifidobacterium pongonis]MBW3094494.1 cell division protein [Bifidobacterium pongonis]
MSEQNDVEHPTGYVDLTGDPVVDMTDNENAPAQTGAAPMPPAPAPMPPTGTATPLSETVASEPAFDGDATDDAPKSGEPSFKSPFPLPDLRENAEDDEDPSHNEFTTVYDVIGKLEDTLNEAKGGFFSPGLVKVDRDALMANLDELKKMLPVQLERASALMREAERRLESAQTQANAIVAAAQSRAADTIKEANDQAQFLAGQENVTELARQKARTILNTAQAKADHLTQGADDYSAKVMEGLRQQLTKLTSDVDAGLNVLHERQRAAAEQLPHVDQNDYPEA